jgi:hypothetical protein
MILAFKVDGKTYKVEFQTSVSKNNVITCIPKTTKDVDTVDTVISQSQAMVVQKGIQQHIEKVLRIPIEIERDYTGPGFGFTVGLYDLVKGL